MELSKIKYLKVQFLCYMVGQTALRLFLMFLAAESLSWYFVDLAKTLCLGAVFDAAAAVWYVLPLAAMMFFLPARWLSLRKGRWLVGAVTFSMNLTAVMMAVAQVLFWQEFGTNFNFIAVDYLVYTTEVLGNIWESYNVPLILTVVLPLCAAATKLQMRHLDGEAAVVSGVHRWARRMAFAVLLVFLPWASVNFTDSRWRLSVSPVGANRELAGNGAYELFHAFFENELNYPAFYVTRRGDDVVRRLREELAGENVSFLSEKGILRRVDNHNDLSGRKLNVVMVVVESLSSDFCGAFGGHPSWTPNLDRLAAQSFVFSRMYATGTRTVRGLEALSLSVPPTPGQSILRRPESGGVNTLGQVMKSAGYCCDFLYGGYGYFDNMNGFFSSNGFSIIDRTDIPSDRIFSSTVWGVADEILFSRVLESLDEHDANGQKAFELVMTTSNHRPYTFPEDRIDAMQKTREGACRYTDWALGDFLRRASSKPWFDRTVFVVVADHQASAAGHVSLPVGRYHIPCLIYAPKLIAPGVCARLASQIDLPPTLLAMLGISYDSQFMGYDLGRTPPERDRAFISTYQSLGLIRGESLIVLSPRCGVEAFHIDDWQQSHYDEIDVDPQMLDEAVMWYQGASELYGAGMLKYAGGKSALSTGSSERRNF
ncbi:MAG: LTA synthase family protein [Pyramidobacter sp.]|jgi:phosphoglycerol transferase MdoB-like AlkP superfamily enzyme